MELGSVTLKINTQHTHSKCVDCVPPVTANVWIVCPLSQQMCGLCAPPVTANVWIVCPLSQQMCGLCAPCHSTLFECALCCLLQIII
jgi:hypothetical protein